MLRGPDETPCVRLLGSVSLLDTFLMVIRRVIWKFGFSYLSSLLSDLKGMQHSAMGMFRWYWEEFFFFLNQWFYSCWHCSVLLIKLDIVCVCVNFWWKEGSVCVVWLKKNPWSNCSWLIIKVFLPNCSFVFCHLFFPSWYPIFDRKHLGSWEIFIVWTGSYSYRVQMA